MNIIKSSSEINELEDKANVYRNEGSKYPGMSYEEGILATLEWLRGDTTDHPLV